MLEEVKSTVEKKMRELKENYWLSETEVMFLKNLKVLKTNLKSSVFFKWELMEEK